MSVFKTGSHTTCTRSLASGNSPSSSSSAEAPRTQTGHVGESRTRIRTSPAFALNAARNSASESGPIVASGACPSGTRRGASFIQAKTTRHTTSTIVTSVRPIFSADLIFTRSTLTDGWPLCVPRREPVANRDHHERQPIDSRPSIQDDRRSTFSSWRPSWSYPHPPGGMLDSLMPVRKLRSFDVVVPEAGLVLEPRLVRRET